MPDFTFADDRLSVVLHQHDDYFTCDVTDRHSGHTWTSPLLSMEVHHKPLRREMRVDRYRVDRVEPCDDGVYVLCGSTEFSIALGLWLRLRDGELSVMVSPPEVYEREPALYRLFAIDVLPELMAVGPHGTIMLPLGGGASVNPAGKPRARDRFLVYGEQDRWELGTTLPYCAVQSKKGGWVNLARLGPCDMQVRIATDGRGHGQTGMAITFRRFWPDPVDPVNRELRLCPLTPETELVPAIVERLRRYVLEDLGKKTLKERAAESPEIDYVLDAFTMKLFHASENEGAENVRRDKSDSVSYLLYMPFKEAAAALSRLKDAGIEKVHTKSTGWNARGHDGLYPQRFPVDERLGGEAGFRALIAHGQALGYQMHVHDNFMMNIPRAANYDEDVLIVDMFGEPLVSGWWGGGIEYHVDGLALPYERLQGHMQRVRDLGVRGMYYCDYMMRPLEVNYHPKRRGPRSASCAGQLRILQAAKEVFGSSATEYGILPAAVEADYISAGGGMRKGDPSWPVAELIDRPWPIWNLVLSGLTLHENTKPDWEGAMRRTLWGHQPRTEWSTRPGRFPVIDDILPALVAINDLSVKRFGHLRRECVLRWEEIGEQVEHTHFSDGTEVVADFNEMTLLVNGERVEQPAALK